LVPAAVRPKKKQRHGAAFQVLDAGDYWSANARSMT
jgi:hypothetical protein